MTGQVFGITGWKNSGKTTLTERLIACFTRRGLRVAAIKHAHHNFDIDHPGTDSFRHRAAGAVETVVASSRRWAIMHEMAGQEQEPNLRELLSRLSTCDVILVEGYKSEPHPKIECRRAEARDHTPLHASVPGVLAIAADHPVEDGLPTFSLDDVEAIADFIEGHLRLTGRKPGIP